MVAVFSANDAANGLLAGAVSAKLRNCCSVDSRMNVGGTMPFAASRFDSSTASFIRRWTCASAAT
jgi:hypothetical protein